MRLNNLVGPDFSQRFFTTFPFVFPTLLVALALGGWRFFSLQNPLMMVLQIVLFILGVVAAHLLFLSDQFWKRSAESIVDKVAEWEGQSQSAHFTPMTQTKIPVTPNVTTPSAPILKQGIFLFIIPVLGLLMVATSRSAFGLGFIWGISILYALDVWHYFTPRQAQVKATYFPHWPDDSLSMMVSGGYLLYVFFLTLALIAL